ncbi:MAG: hypothetical protein IBX41_06630 [Methanophagales archaeon]|nr:hypothetical protein [Methanophagales archaeon]
MPVGIRILSGQALSLIEKNFIEVAATMVQGTETSNDLVEIVCIVTR